MVTDSFDKMSDICQRTIDGNPNTEVTMKKNMGSADRVLRVLVALVVGGLIVTGTLVGIWAWILGILAVVFVLTASVSVCPMYTVLGLRSNKTP